MAGKMEAFLEKIYFGPRDAPIFEVASALTQLIISYISHRGSPYYIKKTYFGRPKHVLVFMVIQNYKQLPLVVKQSTKPHSCVCCWLLRVVKIVLLSLY